MKKFLATFLFAALILPSIVPVASAISAWKTEAKDLTRNLTYEKRMTPLMGWSSWNALGGSISEDSLKKQMDAMVSTGLRDAGYIYFNIDDTYQNGRDETTGRLLINSEKFPNGLKVVSDYAKKLGLKPGIYSDGGTHSCFSDNGKNPVGRNVGLYLHEEDDLHRFLGEGTYRDTYAQNNPSDPGVECWGFDFIKVDWCGGVSANLSAENQYTKIANIISEIENEFKKDIVFNICCWAYHGPWQLQADSWRVSGDIDMSGRDYKTIERSIDIMKELSALTGPGHVNDPDMLVVGKELTHNQDVTQFALWCMFSAPLVIGQDLTDIKQETLDLLKNPELIAINQDSACLSAAYVKDYGTPIATRSWNGDTEYAVELWVKPLGSADSDTKAIALVNRTNTVQTVTLDMAEVGYSGDVHMRELIRRCDLEDGNRYTVTLEPYETTVIKTEPVEQPTDVLLHASMNALAGSSITLNGQYLLATSESQTSDIRVIYSGNKTAYQSAVRYNGNADGVKVTNGKIQLTLPGGKQLQTATLYLSGRDIRITSVLNGKQLSESVSTDTVQAYQVQYFAGEAAENLQITVEGAEIFFDAVSVSSDVTGWINGTNLISDKLADFNLTQKGTADWYYRGKQTVRKLNGGKQIRVFASDGEGIEDGVRPNISWSDGDTQKRSDSTVTGFGTRLYHTGSYYEITVPASPIKRTLTVPFASGNADVKAEFFIGDSCLWSQTITGAGSGKTFEVTYSATADAVAVLKLTIINGSENAGNEGNYIFLSGIALGIEKTPFLHLDAGNQVGAYPDAPSDSIRFGNSGEHLGSGILSSYMTSEGVSYGTAANGDKMTKIGDRMVFVLPTASGLTRADIRILLTNASVSVRAMTNGRSESELLTDVDGGKEMTVSVWYDGSCGAQIALALQSVAAKDASLVVKSIELFQDIAVLADYPNLSAGNGKLKATVSAMRLSGSGDVSLICRFGGQTVSKKLTLTEDLKAYEVEFSIPSEFTSGNIALWLADSSGNALGAETVYSYPLTNRNGNDGTENRIGGVTARYYVKAKNAMLIDVRSAAEFANGSISGAVNLEYTSIIEESAKPNGILPKDKDAYIIVFCATAKRSAQAAMTLTALGYRNVFNLGSIDKYEAMPEATVPSPSTSQWEAGNSVHVVLRNVDDESLVSVKYAFGENASLANASELGASGFLTLPNVEDACRITLYLVWKHDGTVISETSVTYPMTLQAPEYEDVDIFLSDMNYTKSGTLADLTRNDVSLSGGTIVINNKVYSKGVSMNAEANGTFITVNVPKNAAYFVAVAGQTYIPAATDFKVYFDAKEAYSVNLSDGKYQVIKLKIPEGTKKLKLGVIGEANCNHCSWGYAGFVLKNPEMLPEVDLTDEAKSVAESRRNQLQDGGSTRVFHFDHVTESGFLDCAFAHKEESNVNYGKYYPASVNGYGLLMYGSELRFVSNMNLPTGGVLAIRYRVIDYSKKATAGTVRVGNPASKNEVSMQASKPNGEWQTIIIRVDSASRNLVNAGEELSIVFPDFGSDAYILLDCFGWFQSEDTAQEYLNQQAILWNALENPVNPEPKPNPDDTGTDEEPVSEPNTQPTEPDKKGCRSAMNGNWFVVLAALGIVPMLVERKKKTNR